MFLAYYEAKIINIEENTISLMIYLNKDHTEIMQGSLSLDELKNTFGKIIPKINEYIGIYVYANEDNNKDIFKFVIANAKEKSEEEKLKDLILSSLIQKFSLGK